VFVCGVCLSLCLRYSPLLAVFWCLAVLALFMGQPVLDLWPCQRAHTHAPYAHFHHTFPLPSLSLSSLSLSLSLIRQNLVRQVVDLKQELAQSIVTRLQRIMSVQRLIKDCKKTHNVTGRRASACAGGAACYCLCSRMISPCGMCVLTTQSRSNFLTPPLALLCTTCMHAAHISCPTQRILSTAVKQSFCTSGYNTDCACRTHTSGLCTRLRAASRSPSTIARFLRFDSHHCSVLSVLIHVCVYIVYTHACMCIHIRVYACMYVCMYVCMCTLACVHVLTCIIMNTCACKCMSAMCTYRFAIAGAPECGRAREVVVKVFA